MNARKARLPTAIGYLRVSSADQKDTIEQQRRALIASASKLFDIRHFVVEGGGADQTEQFRDATGP
jgi:DNA invertase Pin-like site-specific DNA recombinase